VDADWDEFGLFRSAAFVRCDSMNAGFFQYNPATGQNFLFCKAAAIL
jgi:hypothetical protein